MSTVAQCADSPAPPDGAAFSSCTSVVWVSSQSVSDLSQADIAELFGAVVVLFAGVFVWRALRKVF